MQWIRENFVVHNTEYSFILNNEKYACIYILFKFIVAQVPLRIVTIFDKLHKSEWLDIQNFLSLIFSQVYDTDLIIGCELCLVR